MIHTKLYIKLLSIFSLTLVASCSNDSMTKPATIQVVLIDAPADYQEVNVELVDVQINTNSEETPGWISVENAAMGTYDLLKLTNGTEAFLGSIELPQGELSQLRMILGSNNELVVDGETKSLTVPSGSETGLKLNINQLIESGFTYKLVIDFDAARSIVKAGSSGKYLLKPVLRASFEAQTGAITGAVSPTADAVVYGIKGTDSIGTYLDETSSFTLKALEAGIYDVVVIPSDTSSSSTLTKTTISDVTVTIGEQTNVGTISIIQ